jgi:hypothetical protein
MLYHNNMSHKDMVYYTAYLLNHIQDCTALLAHHFTGYSYRTYRMTANVQFTFCPPICYRRIWRLKQQNYNSASCFTWVWNLVLRMREEGCLKQCAKIFMPKKGNVTWDWKQKMHNEKLHDLCSTPKFLMWLNRGGQYRWATWHASARREMHTGFWWGNFKERDHLEDLCTNAESQ